MYVHGSEYKRYKWLKCAVSSDPMALAVGDVTDSRDAPCALKLIRAHVLSFHFPPRLPSSFSPFMPSGGVSSTLALRRGDGSVLGYTGPPSLPAHLALSG